MPRKYLSCADTAKLVRKSLKEAFPGVKFSVRSSTYSMGAEIHVRWIDGPNVRQVEDVVGIFSGSYFDSSIDYRGGVFHMLDGEQVRFGCDGVDTHRDHSDEAVARAIARVYRELGEHFERHGRAMPTVEQYRRGELWNMTFPDVHTNGLESVQADVNKALGKHSDRLKVEKSNTAARVFITHDDGYSRDCGAGISAVPVDR